MGPVLAPGRARSGAGRRRPVWVPGSAVLSRSQALRACSLSCEPDVCACLNTGAGGELKTVGILVKEQVR